MIDEGLELSLRRIRFLRIHVRGVFLKCQRLAVLQNLEIEVLLVRKMVVNGCNIQRGLMHISRTVSLSNPKSAKISQQRGVYVCGYRLINKFFEKQLSSYIQNNCFNQLF